MRAKLLAISVPMATLMILTLCWNLTHGNMVEVAVSAIAAAFWTGMTLLVWSEPE